MRTNETTDDKLTENTKKLIDKRQQMKAIRININQKIELAELTELVELQKLVKRKIREDCRR